MQISGSKSSSNCEGHVAEKAHRAPIPKTSSSSRAKGILDLVQADLCGPIEVSSIRSARYFVMFIDDHSN